MKKFLLTLLSIVVALALLGGAGFVGYRIGFTQGVRTARIAKQPSTNNNVNPSFPNRLDPHNNMPFLGPNMNDRNWGPGFMQNHTPMMHNRNFGFAPFFFFPLQFAWHILLLGLVVWFFYWLFTKSGWQITRKVSVAQPAPTQEVTQKGE